MHADDLSGILELRDGPLSGSPDCGLSLFGLRGMYDSGYFVF